VTLRAFCYIGEDGGFAESMCLVKARKSRGGDHWSPDDYNVRDTHGKVVGRIMRHPQAPILDHTQFPKGLFQLAALGEARYGRFALLTDIAWPTCVWLSKPTGMSALIWSMNRRRPRSGIQI
jgi:hypothetical protein